MGMKPEPIAVDLIPRGWRWEEQGERCDGTCLLGQLQIGGAMFHVNAIRVEDVEVGGAVFEGITEQVPVKGDAQDYANLLEVYDDALETVEIPGYEGEWVLIIHPYGR